MISMRPRASALTGVLHIGFLLLLIGCCSEELPNDAAADADAPQEQQDQPAEGPTDAATDGNSANEASQPEDTPTKQFSIVRGPANIDDLPTPPAAPGDWPWFLGPNLGNHCAIGQQPPLQWSDDENILWKIDLPGQGHATPCLYGERIFIAAGSKDDAVIEMLCLDRESGEQLWRTEVYSDTMPKIHNDTSHAAATPACDGERVYFPYQTDGEVRMAALDMHGAIVWDESLSPYESIQGFSASPVLYRSAVIVVTDGTHSNRLTALHRKTGELIWQANIPAENENYATAIVADVAGRPQAILVGPGNIRSHSPDTGDYLWEVDGPALCYVAAAVTDEDTVYATGGYPKKALLAIRADGAGNVTDTHVAWKSDRKAGYVPTPLLHEGLLYAVADNGLMRCYDAADGDILWEQELDAKFYSSPVVVNDTIYVFDRKGKGYVFRTGQAFELLAENTLPEGVFATPVIADSRIYLRTLDALYCIGSD